MLGHLPWLLHPLKAPWFLHPTRRSRHLTSNIGEGEAPLGRAAVRAEHQQQPVAAGGDRHRAVVPAPRPQQRGVLGPAVEGRQAVVVTASGQAAPGLQLQVQEEDFDPVAWGQLDAPLALEVVGVEVGVLRAGEVPLDGGVDFLALSCLGEKKGKLKPPGC